ncbi:MAG: hypothetical protein M3454_11820 [Actinomycetota bacterium]|nr:hypothetical protein [Actinomycetota bacterium]
MEDLVTVLESALDHMAALVMPDGQTWGSVAADFQWRDATHILDPESPPFTFITRSRGSGKTDDLGGLLIAVSMTQLPEGSRSYAAAADRDQAKLLLDSIAGFVTRTPLLSGRWEIGSYRATELATGSTIDVLAADAAGSYGIRSAFTTVDELCVWPQTPSHQRLWESLSSSAAKSKASRLVIISTPSDPAHWSRRIYDHAVDDPLWNVLVTEGPSPWIDPERIEEQKRRLTDSAFQQLFEGRWTPGEDRLTTIEALRDCATLSGPLDPIMGKSYTIGLDLGVKNDRSAAAVCHGVSIDPADREEGDPTKGLKIVVDRMAVWSGTRSEPVQLREVEEWLVQASRLYNGAKVVTDPWQAIGSAQRLRDTGITVTEFSFSSSSVGRLASTLHLLLRNRRLAFDAEDTELFDELAGVQLREVSPGVLRMDHSSGTHDDRAISVSLAAQDILEHAPRAYSAATPWELLRVDPWSNLGGGSGEEVMPNARTIMPGRQII